MYADASPNTAVQARVRPYREARRKADGRRRMRLLSYFCYLPGRITSYLPKHNGEYLLTVIYLEKYTNPGCVVGSLPEVLPAHLPAGGNTRKIHTPLLCFLRLGVGVSIFDLPRNPPLSVWVPYRPAPSLAPKKYLPNFTAAAVGCTVGPGDFTKTQRSSTCTNRGFETGF